MSSLIERKPSSDLPKVIVRAWGDEPVPLVAHAIDKTGTRVLVGQPDSKKPLSLPIADVFDYSAERFEELKAAHSSGDKAALRGLYEKIKKPDKSSSGPCTKYQDALISAHEEKRQITDSRSAT